ncbi:hypothetical protein [Streptomyces sp. SAJ15]|uniref:hypothetical protein n=1 Tax=Streptomyces sp. SAJ15 TaxID=2011095 RepID=UPI00118725BF|nr:hypothetical protein [Streptomyces sp. SAJ15]TVL88628.1 hypothetical protein CD790_30335 [Streptomyces sp. SAJ15]
MWTIIGVALGGLISVVAQYWQGRVSERGARRTERLTHLIDFLSAVQEAERVAVDHYHHDLADEQWQARAKQVIDRVWVTQKTIHMLCASEVNEAARRLAFDVQDVIRDGPGDPGQPQDEKVWEYIRPSRRAFLDAVRDYLK